MVASWRPSLVALLALALLPAGAAAQAPDGPLGAADLEELEGLLHELGFDPGPVDGVVDADTTGAIRRYQDFALLTGEPEPSERLLDELRGVAAAFAALNAGKGQAAAAVPEAPSVPAPLPDKPPGKTIVPPPPPPPKLMAPEEAPEEAAEEAPEEAERLAEQMAALPPPTAMPQPLPPDQADSAEPGEEAGPAATLQARIDAELLRFLHQLQGGSLTREDLARQFNSEGRALLQQAQYDDAILKFSVAIYLDPGFAGAYANRGTAYQRQKEAALAEADFDKAKELGFASFRAKGKSNPLD